MWKKVLWLIAGILVITMTVSGVMTAANADDATAGGPPPAGPGGHGAPGGFGAMLNDNLTARVATILGIDKSKLTDAFQQAEKDLGAERMNNMFAQWVTDGKLTQTQADTYKAWLASKPDNVPLFGSSDNVTRDTNMLNRLLKDGKLTQAQFDSATAWLATKPAISLPKPEKPANASGTTTKSWTDRSTAMLDQLLKDGKITQATYDAYKTWYSQKPSVELPAPARGPHGPQGGPQGAPPAAQ
jgi:polyhydroxyalkanoate synthesis regulator phasin